MIRLLGFSQMKHNQRAVPYHTAPALSYNIFLQLMLILYSVLHQPVLLYVLNPVVYLSVLFFLEQAAATAAIPASASIMNTAIGTILPEAPSPPVDGAVI